MLDLVERQKRSARSEYEIQLGNSIGSSHEIFSFVGDSLKNSSTKDLGLCIVSY